VRLDGGHMCISGNIFREQRLLPQALYAIVSTALTPSPVRFQTPLKNKQEVSTYLCVLIIIDIGIVSFIFTVIFFFYQKKFFMIIDI
jgi:hypothetical protein